MQGSRPQGRSTRWTVRVIALVGLIVMALLVLLVVSVSLDGSDEGSDSGSKSASPECTPGAEKAVEAGYYILKEGEGLSDVVDKTCVELDRIERLNPNLDPMDLPPRGCVDLVKDGCKALAAQG